MKPSLQKALCELYHVVSKDTGGRGIASFTNDLDFTQAAEKLWHSGRVCILTGFPCNLDREPSTETDGPSGTFALARALIKLKKKVTILTGRAHCFSKFFAEQTLNRRAYLRSYTSIFQSVSRPPKRGVICTIPPSSIRRKHERTKIHLQHP
eukprot:Filipodium_phascolosomae@DN2614_c0_g1_i12.p1